MKSAYEVNPSRSRDFGVNAIGSPLYTARTPTDPSFMRHVSKINELPVGGHVVSVDPSVPSAEKSAMIVES